MVMSNSSIGINASGVVVSRVGLELRESELCWSMMVCHFAIIVLVPVIGIPVFAFPVRRLW